MCDIWKKKPKHDLPLEKIDNLLFSLKNIRSVSLTGGEPFLRDDLKEIYLLIKERFPKCKVSISTNGLCTKKIIDFVKHTGRDVKFYVSIDGIETHDYIRGITNAFEKTLKTIILIKKYVPVTIKFTITPWNFEEILKVYDLSRRLDVDFQIKIIENLPYYTNPLSFKENNFSFTGSQKKIIVLQLKKLKKFLTKHRKLKDAFFVDILIKHLTNKDFKMCEFCGGVFTSVFIDPKGDVYLCRNFKPIGNITHQNINDIWNSKEAEHIRNLVKTKRCNNKCISLYAFYN